MTRVVLIDNYDSFTYNLFHQLARRAGRPPRVFRNDEVTPEDLRRLDPDVIVCSPGPGSPSVATDLGVCASILTSLETPVLGVCLGFQALVAAAGGDVGRVQPMHGRDSQIVHLGTDLFAGLPQRFSAIRYHSLAARPPLPDSLELTAWTPDGLPMGVRHRERPAWGVQFHPESIRTEQGDELIENFLRLAHLARPFRSPAGWSAPDLDSDKHREPVRPASPARDRGRDHDREPVRPVSRARCHRRRLDAWVEPEDAFVGLYGEAPRAFWLDSSLTAGGVARFSFIGAERAGGVALSYDVAEHRVTVRRGNRTRRHTADLLDVLRSELERISLPRQSDDLPFPGGYVGYLGYEVGAECDGRPVAPVRKRFDHPSTVPDAYWMLADRFLAFDHQTRVVHAVALQTDDHDEDACRAWLAEIADALPCLGAAADPTPSDGVDSTEPLTLRLDREPERYLADIAACQEAIRAGESYELCLTTQAELAPVGAPLDLYRVLRRVSPAPYAAYLRLDDVVILSSSPERFLHVDADRRVTSKPMKGTAPRHADPASDRRSRDSLSRGAKDRSENLMIVDLLRNDLGRVCEIDSVTVPALMEVESYATVHQLVSTVTGRLRDDLGVVDAIRAAFPGGSMTGAPKLRSMEILDRLEPLPRGVYSGSLGYLAADGRAELNIVIRTAVCTPERTTVGLGGAIVDLSDADAEFQEIVLKSEGIVRAVLAWQRRPFHVDAFEVLGPRADQHV